MTVGVSAKLLTVHSDKTPVRAAKVFLVLNCPAREISRELIWRDFRGMTQCTRHFFFYPRQFCQYQFLPLLDIATQPLKRLVCHYFKRGGAYSNKVAPESCQDESTLPPGPTTVTPLAQTKHAITYTMG